MPIKSQMDSNTLTKNTSYGLDSAVSFCPNRMCLIEHASSQSIEKIDKNTTWDLKAYVINPIKPIDL